MTQLPSAAAQTLALQVRQRLVAQADQVMLSLLAVVQARLTELMDEAVPWREAQQRRDTWAHYQRHKTQWHEAVAAAWQHTLQPTRHAAKAASDGVFELVGTEVVENKILASRLALNLMEHAAQEVNDLRKRLKSLQGERDLPAHDLVHPEALLLPLVEHWVACGLSQEAWQSVADVVQRHLAHHLQAAYAQCNTLLIDKGVLPVIDFAAPKPARPVAPAPVAGEDGWSARAEGNAAPSGHHAPLPPGHHWRSARAQGLLDQIGQWVGGSAHPSARALAQPASRVAPRADDAPILYAHPPSEALLAAVAQQPVLGEGYWVSSGAAGQVLAPEVVGQMAVQLRQQSAALKNQASTEAEKAIIELVALMFQAILQEDRIPPGVRVWFARLQMPVLRLALQEPAFFQKLDHPARLLIDRMGSCVMGFDASGISSATLESEIKRVVQVIEQYPETGQKVYAKVYDEFQAFLKQHLTEKPVTQKLVGVAQQVEQKETLAIQFTIELRNQLKDMPVRDEIRDFLFKVWAEVLALSAVRKGSKHEDTLLLKKAASDLIWAASAKPNRADRARVIADLPDLLQCLRDGLNLLNMPSAEQEDHIKRVSAVLVEAFMSKTQAIADDQIQALAARLANLEDYIGDDDAEELPLDSQSIEELLDVDASALDVILEGGGKASAVMLAWAHELDLGAWFTLKFNGQEAQVQYAWRSPMGHLHLFATSVGHSYLLQTVRLAAYLQSGLLEPQEAEPLTQRATRDALDKLQANPAQLLA